MVKRNKQMIVLQSSTYKGGLDMLDDPECNLGDQIYYYFVPDWLCMDVDLNASGCLERNFRSVGDHIYYYFVPDWPGMDANRSVSEGLEPNFEPYYCRLEPYYWRSWRSEGGGGYDP